MAARQYTKKEISQLIADALLFFDRAGRYTDEQDPITGKLTSKDIAYLSAASLALVDKFGNQSLLEMQGLRKSYQALAALSQKEPFFLLAMLQIACSNNPTFLSKYRTLQYPYADLWWCCSPSF